jgi:hypothetical protein
MVDVPNTIRTTPTATVKMNCNCLTPWLDVRGRCRHCKGGNRVYLRIVEETVEKNCYHERFASYVNHQTRHDDKKLEEEAKSYIWKKLSGDRRMGRGEQVLLEDVILMCNEFANEAVWNWIARRNPLLLAYAIPAVHRCFGSHFISPYNDDEADYDELFDVCVECDSRDLAEPAHLRKRAEQYVLDFLDSQCGTGSAVQTCKNVAKNAADDYVHNFIYHRGNSTLN